MLKNPWGLLDGDPDRLVRVEDVPSGLACNCFCPALGCRARFVAVHCQSPRQSYFRHHNADDCGASYESAVHLLAKRILEREKQIMLPYLDVHTSRSIARAGTFSVKDRLVKRQLFRFDHAELEVWMDGRIPDVVLRKRVKEGDYRKLLVEIVVTHDICEDKLRWIQERNLATIKVYLGWADQAISEAQLRQCLMKGRHPWGGNIVCWVHHPKLNETQRAVDDYYLESLRDGTNGPKMSLKNRGQRRVATQSEWEQQPSTRVTKWECGRVDSQRRLF